MRIRWPCEDWQLGERFNWCNATDVEKIEAMNGMSRVEVHHVEAQNINDNFLV